MSNINKTMLAIMHLFNSKRQAMTIKQIINGLGFTILDYNTVHKNLWLLENAMLLNSRTISGKKTKVYYLSVEGKKWASGNF